MVAARRALVEKALCCAAKAGRAAVARMLLAGRARESAASPRGEDIMGVASDVVERSGEVAWLG